MDRFEAADKSAIICFLEKEGWDFEQKLLDIEMEMASHWTMLGEMNQERFHFLQMSIWTYLCTHIYIQVILNTRVGTRNV